jgi:hypothetical protein
MVACAGEIEIASGEAVTPSGAVGPAAYSATQQVAPSGASVPAGSSGQTRNSTPSSTPTAAVTSPAPNTTTPSSTPRASSPSTTGNTQSPTQPAPLPQVQPTPAPTPVQPPATNPTPVPAPVVTAPTPAPETPAPAPVVTQPAPAPAPVTPVQSPRSYAWTDSIQTSTSGNFGFNQLTIEHPIGTAVSGNSDVNLVRAPSPDGNGYALKHTATFADGGSRSQAGIYSFANETFNQLAKSDSGVYIAQEWYFPQAMSAGNQVDTAPWVNLWDWHSVGPNGSDRWDTQPGLMLAEDGSMRVKWSWRQANQETAWSEIELPVGEWFDVEMHYVWTSEGATVSFWINGELALEQHGVKTKGGSHTTIETYMKFYGSANSGPAWTPTPATKYTRNVRMSGERIWR